MELSLAMLRAPFDLPMSGWDVSRGSWTTRSLRRQETVTVSDRDPGMDDQVLLEAVRIVSGEDLPDNPRFGAVVVVAYLVRGIASPAGSAVRRKEVTTGD